MNATQKEAYFQKRKQAFLENDFWILEEDENTLKMKNWEKGPLCTFSYLERETQEFFRLEPKLPNVCITHFFSDNGEMDEFTLEFQMGEYNIEMVAYMEGLSFQEIGVSCFLSKKAKENGWLSPMIPIPRKIRKGIQPIYDHFKNIVAESSVFRLHFVMQDIVFEDLEIRWK